MQADPNKPPWRFRNLRIAWSIMCGILCVLLIVLCVRSYWWTDLLAYRKGQTYVSVATGRGIACCMWRTWQSSVTVGNKLGWEIEGGPTETAAANLKPLEWRRDTDPGTVFG